MTKSSPPDKNVDKMGYMSVMVGDSAALFNAHLEEYGRHYGTAAHYLGQAFRGNDGVAVALLTTAHRVLASLESVVVPWITLGSTLHLAATTITAMATRQQAHSTHQLAMALQHQAAVRRSDQLLQSTTSHAISAVIQTAFLYAHDEGGITDIHLVVSDSYQAAQVRIQLLLQDQDESSGNGSIFSSFTSVTFRVFESLQDAFDAASSPQHTGALGRKILVYVATLQPLYWNSGDSNNDTVLRIHNCHDFVLRADVGHDTGPRLVLNGRMNLENSKGKFHGVALGGGLLQAISDKNDADSLPIQFVRCTTITTTDMSSTRCHALIAAAHPTGTTANGIRRRSGLLLAGSVLASTAVSALFYYTTNSSADSTNKETRK
jgi:hypothetical protein